MNIVITIRIFFKGLKNAHSLATHIYEKGSQTLCDAISEVEKLKAVQQLTATIIPSSTVKMMSNEKDHCFQCQEEGHITWKCPNIRCFECDKYGHIVMDCPTQDTSFGNPSKTSPTQTSQKLPCQIKLKVPPWRQIQAKSFQITIPFSQTLQLKSSWFIRGCTRSQHSHSTYRDYSHQSHCDTPHWPHCRSSTHRRSSVYHSRDHSRSHSCPSYKSSRWDLHRSHSHSSRSWGKPHLKNNLMVKIEDPHMDYYSSDEHSSDSGEEANHLNWMSPLQVVTPMDREGYLHMTRLQWHSSWIVQPLQYMQENAIWLL